MQTYIILTKFTPGAFATPTAFKQVSARLTAKIKQACPDLHWKASYSTAGRYDVVDVVEADDPDEVHRAAILINTDAYAFTETMVATPWSEYLAQIADPTHFESDGPWKRHGHTQA